VIVGALLSVSLAAAGGKFEMHANSELADEAGDNRLLPV
jgi:hypothetical protein